MTPFIKKKEIKQDWYLINAENAAVGRLAAFISKVLRGKNKSTYNPHIDNGDLVVVTNIDKMKFSGKKIAKSFSSSTQEQLMNDLEENHWWYIGLRGYLSAVFKKYNKKRVNKRRIIIRFT